MSNQHPHHSATTPVVIYTTSVCGYCVAAKRLLQKMGVLYTEVDLSNDYELRESLSAANGDYRTVPMIFVEGKFVGGFTDLSAVARDGGLDHLVTG